MADFKHDLYHVDSYLAPYAIKSASTRGRKYKEKESELRNPFQRDRDRIIHSTAFRRLQYKTQVFVNHEGDHYRTRLTHTLEAAQIARTVARTLRLNEDLSEAIALAHDLGHGPFGHAGEWALEALMKGKGGFEHNEQGVRIVEKIENSYPEFPGLNLCFETVEGIKKHPERFYKDKRKRFRSLEAELVDIADEIAYNSHDLDDGLRSGLISEKQIKGLEICKGPFAYIRKKYSKITAQHRRRLAIRLIINFLVRDLIDHATARIQDDGLRSPMDLQGQTKQYLILTPGARRAHLELKKFLYKNLYQHDHVIMMTKSGQRILQAVFKAYVADPTTLPAEIRAKFRQEGKFRVICDYVAGMTDRFALSEHHRLFEAKEGV